MSTLVFVPLCMTPEELVSWGEMNALTSSHRVDRPCSDCPAVFAAEMRAADRCNGVPLGDRRRAGPSRPRRLTPAQVAAARARMSRATRARLARAAP